MEDREIVQLYWDRDERAIPATAKQYGAYCTVIADNILGNPEDAEECVNDTYLKAWNSMPPHRPVVLAAFLGKITRNLAFNRYQSRKAEKRGGGETALVLDELSELVSGKDDVGGELDRQELLQEIEAFLGQLPTVKRRMFLCRYWYADRVSDIAKRFGVTENQVSVTLSRVRGKLKEYLKKRGFEG